MNLRKIGVVLLALLLAGMAMVPMVSAVDEKISGQQPAPAVQEIQLPELQFNSTQQKCRYPVNFIWIRGFRLSPQQSTSLPLS